MLINAAADTGEVRADVAPYDLLHAIGNLDVSSGEDGLAHTERMIMLLLDGQRYSAAGPKQPNCFRACSPTYQSRAHRAACP